MWARRASKWQLNLGKWFRSSLRALFSNRHHLAAFPVETEIVRIDAAAGRDQPPVTWNSRWRNFGSLWEKALDLQTVFRADFGRGPSGAGKIR
jgi:hypothetical protein